MEQVDGSICAPKGFYAAGTYSGVCNYRIKLDLAMIMSRTDCSIVTIGHQCGYTANIGRTLLYHNGLALPVNGRGNEITTEICNAVSRQADISSAAVSVITTGLTGQYFRPSLLVNSINTLTASLSTSHGDLVKRVMDNGRDVLSGAVSFHTAANVCTMGGIISEGTEDVPGLCMITTDLAVMPQQIQRALTGNTHMSAMQGYDIIIMANGLAASAGNEGVFAKAVQGFLAHLGVLPYLKKAVNM